MTWCNMLAVPTSHFAYIPQWMSIFKFAMHEEFFVHWESGPEYIIVSIGNNVTYMILRCIVIA